MTQTWRWLLFAHWRVDATQLRRMIAAPFELDLFDGEAWLGVVPFYMTNVALKGTPSLPWLSSFPELNVRTYVRVADRPGIYFFSLDAGRRLAVAAARTLLNLPYYAASMTVNCLSHGVRYRSVRRATCPAEFKAEYSPDRRTVLRHRRFPRVLPDGTILPLSPESSRHTVSIRDSPSSMVPAACRRGDRNQHDGRREPSLGSRLTRITALRTATGCRRLGANSPARCVVRTSTSAARDVNLAWHSPVAP